jgi:hypothetical protein
LDIRGFPANAVISGFEPFGLLDAGHPDFLPQRRVTHLTASEFEAT